MVSLYFEIRGRWQGWVWMNVWDSRGRQRGKVEGKWAAELYEPDSLYFFSEVGGKTIC